MLMAVGTKGTISWLVITGSTALSTFDPQIPARLYNSAAAEPFLNGSNTSYVEEMYNNWLRDPASVHAVSFRLECHCHLSSEWWPEFNYHFVALFAQQSWDAYFRSNSYVAPPSLAPAPKGHVSMSEYRGAMPQMGGFGGAMTADERVIDDHLDVQAIIRSYQV